MERFERRRGDRRAGPERRSGSDLRTFEDIMEFGERRGVAERRSALPRRAPSPPSRLRTVVGNVLLLVSALYLCDAYFFDGAHSLQWLMSAGDTANYQAMRWLSPAFGR